MSNNLLILYQPYSIFSDEILNLEMSHLTNQEKQELFSHLMFENYSLSRQNKNYDIFISVNIKDKEKLPTVYNALDTEIIFRQTNNWIELSNQVNTLFNNDFKKTIILFTNSFNLKSLHIKDCFDLLSVENERLVLNFSKDYFLNLIGLNKQKINLSDLLIDNNFSENSVVRNAINLNSEIITRFDGNIVFNTEQLRNLYRYFKSSAFKTFNSQFVLFLTGLNNKYHRLF